MDMTEYVTITGLAIAMGLEDQAPLPKTRAREFEWASAPMLALLNVRPPADLLSEFKTFSGPREIGDKINLMGLTFQAQAPLEDSWMMGAATGMLRAGINTSPAPSTGRLAKRSAGCSSMERMPQK